MGTPFKMKGSGFYGKGNQTPAKNIRPTSGYDIQADEVNQAHNKTDGKPGHHDYVAPKTKGDGESSMKMKSPVKDQEAITGNKHPHTKPKTSTRGIHTDKHGNKTGQVK